MMTTLCAKAENIVASFLGKKKFYCLTKVRNRRQLNLNDTFYKIYHSIVYDKEGEQFSGKMRGAGGGVKP
jgi:hypothetical protein